MKNILKILFVIIPFFGFGQQCITLDNVPNADSVQYCVTNTTCYDTCNGVLSITVWGDNHPYSFEWFNNSTPWVGISVQDTLCPGDYIVTITDVNDDLVNNSHINTIEGPPNFSVHEESLISPSCFNYNDGFIDLTIAGATPFDPDGIANSGDEYYTYLWEEGTSTEDRTSLDSGIYIISMTDANGCNRVDSFELFNPDKVNSQTITDTLSCIGSCDGEAIVIPFDGVGLYTYQWRDGNNGVIVGATNDTAISLCYGISTVYITDSMGCLDTNTVFIENPDTLKLSNITIDSSCYQICDGEISVTIEGGTGPYNVSWNFGGVEFNNTDTITEDTLCPGAYQLIFSDDNNCIDTADIILVERDSFNLDLDIYSDSCFNSCTGSAVAQLSNPNSPPFNYDWTSWTNNPGMIIGPDTDSISNLCSDSIRLELTDVRGCVDTFYRFVYEPPILTIDSVVLVNNTCYNDGTGSISVDVSGGTGTISTLWTGSGGPYTTVDISNLYSGSYTLHIEDQNFCVQDTFFTVTEPDSLFATSSVQNVSCYNYSDGVVDVNIQGGTIPYTITWDLVLSDSTYIDSLVAGDYIYTISDDSGCVFQDTVIVSHPEDLIISDSITNVLCNGYHTGSIDLTITGGNPAYSVVWSDSSTNEDLLNIGEGTYTVTVTDTKGCSENGTYIITEPQFPITFNIVGTDVLCFGGSTGSANLNISGGTTPYSFQWSNADTTEDISNLLAGTYTVDIIDENGCDTTTTINIVESALITITYNETSVLCNGDSTGSVDLTVSGGVSPYTYLWNTGDITQDLDSMPAGTYSVTVTDINLCTETLSLNVSEPSEFISSLTNTNIDCYGYNNGSIDLTPSGGVGNYSFLWSNNESTKDIDNLTPGDYSVIVTDGNGCILYDTSTITDPPELIIANTTIMNMCNGYESGSIDITASGGTGGLSYSWSNGSTTPFINNLASNTYSVLVLDANDCPLTESFIITEPSAYFEIFDVIDVMCFGDLTGEIDFSIISGNTPPYTYAWSNGANTQDLEDLAAGTYTVEVTDNTDDGCPESFDVILTEPEELILEMWSSHATCEENNDGSITTNVAGGTIPYAYFWSNGLYDSDLYNLSKGFYTLEIRDANSCIYPTQTIEVGFEGYDGCIEIPSGFTPNNDGIHDEWAIYGLYNFPDVVVNVHNRWGQRIFFSEGYTVPWDGKNGGVDLPIATYYYVIELKDSGKVFNGTVTIKR